MLSIFAIAAFTYWQAQQPAIAAQTNRPLLKYDRNPQRVIYPDSNGNSRPGPIVPNLDTTPRPAPLAPDSDDDQSLQRNFSWRYDGANYQASLTLNTELLDRYNQQPLQRYQDGFANYFPQFFTTLPGDDAVRQLAEQLRQQAKQRGLSDDQLAELAVAFIQDALSYDNVKAATDARPYFIYQTLARKSGICTDRSFLGWALLRELGFKAAIITMPDVSHAALAIGTKPGQGLDKSGWLYIESTAPAPIGSIPFYSQANQNFSGQLIDNGSSRAANIGRYEIIIKAEVGKNWQAPTKRLT